MKTSVDDHRARPWLVHAIAHDFRLEDLWAFDLGARKPTDVREVLACFWRVFVALSDSRLAKARMSIGRALRWDDHDFALPIPGCTEKRLSERLSESDRARSLVGPDEPSPVASPVVKTVYVFADEAAYEFSNDTIHGLLHIALVERAATLAVYVKHRGVASRLYMASIWPARHLVVYPALIRKIEQDWAAHP